MTPDHFGEFRRRLSRADPLVGSFIKTPAPHATEILGELGFDFVVVDEEHGPFDRAAIDLLMLATRASAIAGVVRVSSDSTILAALDMGADGVLVPHVNSADQARLAVKASRYRGGDRGYSPSSRAGRYGSLGLSEHVARADANASVLVMIEHPDAVRDVEAIAAVDGVDALFLGLGDLAVASGQPTADTDSIQSAAKTVCQAARRRGRAVMAMASSVEAGAWLLGLGVTALIVSSDQGLLRAGAARQLEAFRAFGSVKGSLS